MNTRLANPYVVGAPLSGEQGFYGREDVLQFVRDTFGVPSQNVIVLYGQRRIGKTSLLHQLIARIGPDFHAVLFDLQGKGQHDLAGLLSDLSAEIIRSIKLPLPDPASAISTPDAFRGTFLPAVEAALAPRRLLILFDEFDVLGDEPSSSNDQGGGQFFGYLQHLIAHQPRLACVFVIGRRIDELPIHYRALFKQAIFRRLSVLPRPDAVELITRPADGALNYAPEAVDAILDLTAGHPYLTQLMCHVVFKRVMGAGRNLAIAGDVSACLDEAMEIGTGGLDWFWEGLPRAERIILSALAETLRSGSNGHARPAASEDELLHTLNQHRVRLLGVELTGARQRLVDWEIVAHADAGYCFAVDLVRRWIAHTHPLDRAQHDIDLISQRATRYFNNARDAHLAGDLMLALEDYRRALAANPHHFGAQLGLAQSLQETNDLPTAIAEYEKAYRLDPSSARDGLISARLALGVTHQSRGDLEAAVDQFEQVLRLAPSDDEAHRRLIGIWFQRGETQLAGGDDAGALTAFTQALDLAPEDDALRTRIKASVRRYSESAEARGDWETGFKSLSLLGERLPDDAQLQVWLAETRAKWRAHSYYELAQRARSAGDHLTTIEECRRALDANPQHARARLLLAETLHETGELTDAIEEYEQAYRLDGPTTAPGLVQARLLRAVDLEAQGDLVTAVVDYERALEVQPGSEAARQRLPNIYLRWGDEHLAAGRLDDAIAAFRKTLLVSTQPQMFARPIKARLAEYSQAQRTAGNWDVAIAALTRLRSDLMLRDRESDGWLIDAWAQRGETALNAGRYTDAAAAFRQALHVAADTSDPETILKHVRSLFFNHAEGLLRLTQPDAAIIAFTTLLDIIGNEAETFAALARAWRLRGDLAAAGDRLDEAEGAFRQAIELQPDQPETLDQLAQVADRRKQIAVERLRAQAAKYATRKEWIEAEAVYRQLVLDFNDEVSRPLLTFTSEEIRLAELYRLAGSYQSQSNWDAAIPIWIEICHVRGEYTGADGQTAAACLAAAIQHRDGTAQAEEHRLAHLRRRARLAWFTAALFGVLALSELLYVLSTGPLRLP